MDFYSNPWVTISGFDTSSPSPSKWHDFFYVFLSLRKMLGAEVSLTLLSQIVWHFEVTLTWIIDTNSGLTKEETNNNILESLNNVILISIGMVNCLFIHRRHDPMVAFSPKKHDRDSFMRIKTMGTGFETHQCGSKPCPKRFMNSFYCANQDLVGEISLGLLSDTFHISAPHVSNCTSANNCASNCSWPCTLGFSYRGAIAGFKARSVTCQTAQAQTTLGTATAPDARCHGIFSEIFFSSSALPVRFRVCWVEVFSGTLIRND